MARHFGMDRGMRTGQLRNCSINLPEDALPTIPAFPAKRRAGYD